MTLTDPDVHLRRGDDGAILVVAPEYVLTVDGDRAVLHKKFNGQVAKADGTFDKLNWQTLYFCRRVGPRWKIAGFVGYMPHPLGR